MSVTFGPPDHRMVEITVSGRTEATLLMVTTKNSEHVPLHGGKTMELYETQQQGKDTLRVYSNLIQKGKTP